MPFINVYIEHNTLQLNTTFTYACDLPVCVGCRVRVPFRYSELIGFVQEVNVKTDLKNIRDVIEVIDSEPLLDEELMELAQKISERYVCSVISVLKTMLPPALRPSGSREKIIYENWIIPGDLSVNLTKRQAEDLDQIKDLLPMRSADVNKKIKLLQPLLKRGALQTKKRIKRPEIVSESFESTIPELTLEQKRAIDTISAGRESIYLLHGVTGSGKTEVFLRLAQNALDQGKQVLFLVPEIGLTPMMISRVRARFQTNIAIYHSALNPQEKYDQYRMVKNKEVSIVVGTRSAVFMPFDDLGLILMDEEHDTSYKQDQMPRYHTRDIVLWRAAYHSCKAVLASATPALESYARAYKGIYRLVELTQRVHQILPGIHLVDMKKEPVEQGISVTLWNALETALRNHEQAILLLNRRGYFPTVRCASCQKMMMCPDCGLPLAYHLDRDILMCHCCGRVFAFDHRCPDCHSTQFYQSNMGTEKLEELLKLRFPYARILRMDADSTRKKNAHSKILHEFAQRGDILIGTQMVSKGLDFPRVSVVGILQADASLSRMDYRCAEGAYAMLEQASGRCGRSARGGDVFIQTFDPMHYVMQSVRLHDYKGFFIKEMHYRHLGNYVPYVYLCTVIYSHAKEEKTMQVAQDAKAFLQGHTVLGPVSISMRKQQARVRIVIKHKNDKELQKLVWKLVEHHFSLKTNVKQDINMHPLGLEE